MFSWRVLGIRASQKMSCTCLTARAAPGTPHDIFCSSFTCSATLFQFILLVRVPRCASFAFQYPRHWHATKGIGTGAVPLLPSCSFLWRRCKHRTVFLFGHVPQHWRRINSDHHPYYKNLHISFIKALCNSPISQKNRAINRWKLLMSGL